jgi:multiple sugar transport system ATP-binding protein
LARIELVGLSKAFGSVVAVRNLSLTIDDGEFVVLVGPSGCGKTTTLRMIAGFIDASAGEIRIDGRVANDLEPRDRCLGMCSRRTLCFRTRPSCRTSSSGCA